MKCFKRRNCLQERTSWDHLQQERPSCLTAARVWWSAAPSRFPVTLVTQLSVERLDNLRAQCRFWGGPLAAALHLPLITTSPDALDDAQQQRLQQTIAHADKLFRTAEAAAAADGTAGSNSSTAGGALGCQLRLVLLYELVADEDALQLYPINSLRNYARLLADTDLITNIDVDLLPSASISAALTDPATLATYSAGCRAGSVFVWPAFETKCGGTTYVETVARGPCSEVGPALHKCLRTFRPQAQASHNATNYTHWVAAVAAREGAAAAGRGMEASYPVSYTSMFEPWFLSWRFETLWYDVRYRGYGKNKIVHVAAMNATGISMSVSLEGFLVHQSHQESHAHHHWMRNHMCASAKTEGCDPNSLRDSLYMHVEGLWADARGALANGSYVPWVEESFAACLDSLPWWSGGVQGSDRARFRRYVLGPRGSNAAGALKERA